MKKTLTKHQENIFNNIVANLRNNLLTVNNGMQNLDDQCVSLAGAAGTGKSYLTIQIAKTMKYVLNTSHIKNDGICITAPTHKAVKVLKEMLEINNLDINCQTLQSFLNIKPIYDLNTGEEAFQVDRNAMTVPTASLLIIDESSMISSNLYNYILESISTRKVNAVLFIGDPNQLLPTDNTINPVYHLRNQYYLTQIVRQAEDNDIIKLATDIRMGIEQQSFIDLRILFKKYMNSANIEFFYNKTEFLADYYKNNFWWEEDKMLAAFTNEEVDGLNMYIRNKLWMQKGVSSPTSLMVGDKVRFTKPMVDSNIVNVDICPFSNGEEVEIQIAKLNYSKDRNIKYWECVVKGETPNRFFRVIDNESIPIYNKLLESFVYAAQTSIYPDNNYAWKSYFSHKAVFAHIQFTFASTIHKLQGSTFDEIYIDLSSLLNNEFINDDLKYRLAYVAITRARYKVKILL
jgi:ATP-dependent exoDNAse (exonuclease V) alpha subunit